MGSVEIIGQLLHLFQCGVVWCGSQGVQKEVRVGRREERNEKKGREGGGWRAVILIARYIQILSSHTLALSTT